MASLYNKRLKRNIRRAESYYLLIERLKSKFFNREISREQFLELQDEIGNKCGYCTSSPKL